MDGSLDRENSPPAFTWDAGKELMNLDKHGVDFKTAMKAFLDHQRCIAVDSQHSAVEQRFFCMGKVEGRILTVRFIYRANTIRIIGAGFWRKGKKFYEENNG